MTGKKGHREVKLPKIALKLVVYLKVHWHVILGHNLVDRRHGKDGNLSDALAKLQCVESQSKPL